MSTATPRRAPPASPALIALGLGLAFSLPLLGHAFAPPVHSGAFLLTWPLAALLAVGASQRWRLPSAPATAAGLAWLVAAACGVALIGRRAVDALLVAAAELPISSPVVPGLDLGDALLAAALILMTIPWALRGALRAARPGLALIAVGAVGLLAVPLIAGSATRPMPELDDPGGALPLLSIAAALAWCGALVGPSALALDPKRRWLHGLLPPAVLAVSGGGLAALLWAVSGGHGLLDGDGLALTRAGARAWGSYGGRAGAGLEAALLLLAALLLAVLAARVAARCLPRLGGWVLPLVVIAGVVLQARLSFATLVPLALVTGWLALALGGPNRDAS